MVSQIIGFLEEMGRNPACGRISDADYMHAVTSLQVTPAECQALLVRDHGALNDLLGGRQQMVCTIWQPLEEQDPGRDNDEGPDVPDSLPPPDEEEELKDH